MKNYRISTICALCTILIGALMIVFYDNDNAAKTNATVMLIISIGALFIISGLASMIAYLRLRSLRKKQADKQELTTAADAAEAKKKKSLIGFFPVLGVGSFLFGLILVITPSSFITILLYMLGAFLILAAAMQIYTFVKLRKLYTISPASHILSAVIIICGIIVIAFNYKGLYPEATSIIFGAASILYGISEIAYLIWFRDSGKKASQLTDAIEVGDDEAIDAEIIE